MLQDILKSNNLDRSTKSPCDILATSSKVEEYMRVGYKKPDPSTLVVVEAKIIKENKIIAPPPKPKLAIEPEKKPESTFLTGAVIKEDREEDEDDEEKPAEAAGNKFLDAVNKDIAAVDDQGFHDIGVAVGEEDKLAKAINSPIRHKEKIKSDPAAADSSDDGHSDSSMHLDKYNIYSEGDLANPIELTDKGFIDVGRIEPGGSFGALALIDGKPRMCTTKCITRCHFLTLNKAEWKKAEKDI